MKLIVCKRVPLFAVNPNVEVVCIDEDKHENEVFAIRPECRDRALQLVEVFNSMVEQFENTQNAKDNTDK